MRLLSLLREYRIGCSHHRLFKEHKSYQKEEEDLTRKLNKLIADNGDEWDIKNTVRMRYRVAYMRVLM